MAKSTIVSNYKTNEFIERLVQEPDLGKTGYKLMTLLVKNLDDETFRGIDVVTICKTLNRTPDTIMEVLGGLVDRGLLECRNINGVILEYRLKL